jgi:hypothetical protein
MERTLRTFEAKVSPPSILPYRDGHTLKFVDQTIYQALILKLARNISGLKVVQILVDTGYSQEQAVIQRTLDDITEDIMFLSLGHTVEWTNNHEKYLTHFWLDDPSHSTVKRDAIRSFVNRVGGGVDPTTANEQRRSIFKTYSSFVHVTAVTTMDMYRGDPPVLHVSGITLGDTYNLYVRDAWNYFYRGLVSAAFVSAAFKSSELWTLCYNTAAKFREQQLASASTKG